MTIKRFVAGAVCPKCHGMDKLVIHVGSEPQIRECISCGYSDSLDNNGNIRELSTRVNGPREGEGSLDKDSDVQILKL